jgi:hypothetical protein
MPTKSSPSETPSIRYEYSSDEGKTIRLPFTKGMERSLFKNFIDAPV